MSPLVITVSPNPGTAGRPAQVGIAGAPCDPHVVKVKLGGAEIESWTNPGTSSSNPTTPGQTGTYTVCVMCNGSEVGSTTFQVV